MAVFPVDKRYAPVVLLLMIFVQKLVKVVAQETTTGPDTTSSTITTYTHTAAVSTLPLCYDLQVPGRDSDCRKYGHLCNEEVYYDLMTWQCPATCERCWTLAVTSPRTGIFTNGTCVDLTSPNSRFDCLKYAKLCVHPRYKLLMATECPRTCGYCPVNRVPWKF